MIPAVQMRAGLSKETNQTEMVTFGYFVQKAEFDYT